MVVFSLSKEMKFIYLKMTIIKIFFFIGDIVGELDEKDFMDCVVAEIIKFTEFSKKIRVEEGDKVYLFKGYQFAVRCFSSLVVFL